MYPEHSDDDKTLIGRNKNSVNAYMKYSGMAVQMALIIAVFAWIGVSMDTCTDLNPLFTVIFSLFGVGLAMFVFIRMVLSDNKKDQKEEN